MAVSDGMLGAIFIVLLMYIFLFKHRVRWVRIAGAIGIIIVSGVFGLVEDTAIMYTIFLGNLLICGLQLSSDVSTVVNPSTNEKGFF